MRFGRRKKSIFTCSPGKSLLSLSEMQPTLGRAATGGSGRLGWFSGSAVGLRTAASKAVGLFAVRRSSEIVQFVTSDLAANGAVWVISFCAAEQKSDQLGVR